ncbi:hypothetical protein EI94DRAFT_1871101 [Lactarius quietus]|nr:hypothetical protein EI94DRAFT_1871101 [Lactarius quietus]
MRVWVFTGFGHRYRWVMQVDGYATHVGRPDGPSLPSSLQLRLSVVRNIQVIACCIVLVVRVGVTTVVVILVVGLWLCPTWSLKLCWLSVTELQSSNLSSVRVTQLLLLLVVAAVFSLTFEHQNCAGHLSLSFHHSSKMTVTVPVPICGPDSPLQVVIAMQRPTSVPVLPIALSPLLHALQMCDSTHLPTCCCFFAPWCSSETPAFGLQTFTLHGESCFTLLKITQSQLPNVEFTFLSCCCMTVQLVHENKPASPTAKFERDGGSVGIRFGQQGTALSNWGI